MASAASLALNKFPFGIDNTQRYTYARGVVTLTAGTYTVGGLALSWVMNSLKTTSLPFQVTFFSNKTTFSATASLVVGGFVYLWNSVTNKLQIMTASGGSAGTGAVMEEMADGTALPAAVLNDIIAFEAIFAKNGAY